MYRVVSRETVVKNRAVYKQIPSEGMESRSREAYNFTATEAEQAPERPSFTKQVSEL